MTDYLSNLPVELIYKIVDDITIFDILGCLCLVNKRLRLICLGYNHFRLDLSYVKKRKQFDLFCDRLASISSQIDSLSFSDFNDATMPSKIERFFLRFQVINDKFSNLKSLHLSHVDPIMWKSIKNHVKLLMSLVSLFIDVAYIWVDADPDKEISYLLKDILFMSISLKHAHVRCNNGSRIYLSDICGKQISSIEHLTLTNVSIDLQQLYSIAPGLCTLNTRVTAYHPAYKFHVNPPENLQRLSLNISHLYFSLIEQILHSMKRLTHLIIIASDAFRDVTDGDEWERILTKIKSFKFLFRFHESTWTEEAISLDSFQSLFWLENKQWYVGYDRCTISGFSLLYSIPYCTNIYPWSYMKGAIDTKTTGPQILSLDKVNYCKIDNKFSIDDKRLCRLTNLQKLSISDFDISFHVLLNKFVPHIDMSIITTFCIPIRRVNINNDVFVQFVSTMSNLVSLGAPLILLKLLLVSHWSNIRRLEIFLSWPTATAVERSLTVDEIDVFFRSFTHIEYLSFQHNPDLNISEILNNIPITISNIVIGHPYRTIPADFPNFITPDWLQENTRLRNFSYYCNESNAVSLWL
ncbi:unnamed protein product [Rotaria socialis]|uniref:F-box domain-containing protein n=1 Tax=Rotaria socialis TaxID=392032 RepID=A0A817PTT0_9BILA|nr:unnamed protein product [Rotaria socialis]CAF4144762.1 unnamed protein product [Rotaria socialis]